MTRQKRRHQMLALAQRWSAGTETQERFAGRHGLSGSALQYWVRQMTATQRTISTTPGPAFAPVQLTAAGVVADAAVEVVLVSGERVVVPPQASAEHLRVVLSVLRPSC